MSIGGQLFRDVVLGREHLADLHKGFVLGLGNNKDGVDGHSQTDHAEDQITVRTCSILWGGRTHRGIRGQDVFGQQKGRLDRKSTGKTIKADKCLHVIYLLPLENISKS